MNPAEKYFLSYQSAWRVDMSRLKICQKSRQIGMSYVDGYDSVLKAALSDGRDVWVMSRDETQAKQYIRYCKHWANILEYAAGDHGEQVFALRAGKSVQVQVLSFASGGCIYALSSIPDAIIGKTGHVKLDEFALHKDQRTLYAVAKPVTQWGGTLSIISTHRGAHTVFNRIIIDIKERGNRMGWSLHEIPIQRAVSEGLVEKIDAASGRDLSRKYRAAASKSKPAVPADLAPGAVDGVDCFREWWLGRQRAECIDEEQWLQEYCCVPADESTAFFSYEILAVCQHSDCRRDYDYLERCEHPLYLGMDVARVHDLCVLDVGEKIGDVTWDRLRLELSGKTFSEIEHELYRLLELPEMVRACIDATGMGMQLAERARERFGTKVEPINFTRTVKEQLAFGLRADFEDRKVRI